MQRTLRSFIKNAKERKNVAFFKRMFAQPWLRVSPATVPTRKTRLRVSQPLAGLPVFPATVPARKDRLRVSPATVPARKPQLRASQALAPARKAGLQAFPATVPARKARLWVSPATVPARKTQTPRVSSSRQAWIRNQLRLHHSTVDSRAGNSLI